MAQLRTFNAVYDPAQDRILLQAVGDGWSQNFWITRRVLILLGSVFNALLEKHYTATAQLMSGSTAYAADFAEFAREAALKDNPIQAAESLEAITEAPILVHEIQYVPLGEGVFAIMLKDLDGQGHGYQLREDLLNALTRLLQAQSEQACWGIQLIPPTKTATSVEAPADHRVLN